MAFPASHVSLQEGYSLLLVELRRGCQEPPAASRETSGMVSVPRRVSDVWWQVIGNTKFTGFVFQFFHDHSSKVQKNWHSWINLTKPPILSKCCYLFDHFSMDVRDLLIWGSRGHWKAATRHPSGPIEASSQVPEIFGDGNPQENSDEQILFFFHRDWNL